MKPPATPDPPPQQSPKIPVFLHHGLLGYDQVSVGPVCRRYWHGIDDAIRAAGHPVFVTRVSPTGSIARRASQLRDGVVNQLSAAGLSDRRFIVIGHSMGGLDARHMVAHLGIADRVAAVVTVATPHRGTAFADWAMHHIERRLGLLKQVARFGIEVDAFADLTTDACALFNRNTPDHPDVGYFSVATSRPLRKMPPWAALSHQVIRQTEGANDGLVSLTSARWGSCVATWEADHWQSINRGVPNPFGEPLDIAPAYVAVLQSVLADLRARGRV